MFRLLLFRRKIDEQFYYYHQVNGAIKLVTLKLENIDPEIKEK